MSRVVAVTGAASGIGSAIAMAFGNLNDHVVLLDRDAPAVAAAAERMAERGADARGFPVDVSDSAAVRATIGDVEEKIGPIDVFVDDAGIGVAGSVIDTTDEDLEAVLAVNVKGTFYCCAAVIPKMLERGGGVIVNIASVVGLVGVERRAAYSASKGAVLALTRSIAVDFMASGIRCNAVAPGTVDSPWIARILDKEADPAAARDKLTQRQPIGRLGRPEEIAAAVIYLASPEAAFVHGSCLVIDGGITAR